MLLVTRDNSYIVYQRKELQQMFNVQQRKGAKL